MKFVLCNSITNTRKLIELREVCKNKQANLLQEKHWKEDTGCYLASFSFFYFQKYIFFLFFYFLNINMFDIINYFLKNKNNDGGEDGSTCS